MMITTAATEFASEVRRDLQLTPKQLQSKYLYDPLGSSLFEAICRLPWYRITRAENRLLITHAGEIVSALGPDPTTIVELGPGSGEKLAVLAEALQAAGGVARVHIIDISSQALEQTEQRLTRLQHVSVVGHQSTYEVGLRRAAAARDGDGSMLVLLLGSNIGNFDTPAALAFLRRIRDVLQAGDFLLLGADLVKPERELRLAYDDPLGVTAAFNKNLLVRINRELGGTFNLDAFDHRAAWNALEQRIEMRLVSRADQIVRIEAAGLSVPFVRDEHIWTESSYKYQPDQIEQMGAECGFALRDQWIDADARFALSLMVGV
ncbi:MAG TPA: L-histidine N(alpha)-methyltransferase [Vicinamibacterales bacterium]|nr:L-histidine N(alpha)-methyltransferase [Vicinamibacterales bacterium]